MSDPVNEEAAKKAAEDAKQEEEKKSEKKSSKKSSKKSEKTKNSSQLSSLKSDEVTPVKTNCCCCVCVCSNSKSYGTTCCGCLPVKCGVVTIGIFTLVLTIFLVISNFFLLLNEYIHWWHPAILLVLNVPNILSTCFFVVFFTQDKMKSRGKLPYGCILNIISLSLTAIWTIVYYLAFYKQPVVYVGMNGEYTSTPKKAFVFFRLLQYVILIAAFTYFLCVCQEYKSVMKTERPVKPVAAEAPEEEKKSEKPDEEEKKEGEEEEKKEGEEEKAEE